MSSSQRTAIRERPLPEPVKIVNWPLRDDGLSAWCTLLALVAVSATAGRFAGSAPMGLICFLTLALSVWRLFVPVTFEFSSRGIVQTVWGRRRRIAWRQIARFRAYRHGLHLISDDEPTPLAMLSGVYIRWHDQRDELLGIVQHFLDAQRNTSQFSSTIPYPREDLE